MMDEFLQQTGQIPQDPGQPFAMEHMRRELDGYYQAAPQRAGSPGWAADFSPGEEARLEAAFQAPKVGGFVPAGFTPAEFQRFQQMERNSSTRMSSPRSQTPTSLMGYQTPISMNYGMGTGTGMGMGMGMMGSSYRPTAMQRPASETATQGKGKGRMIELDDQNWEEQFAEIDAVGQRDVDAEANAAIEAELDDMDRSVQHETNEFGDFESIWRGIQAESAANRQMEDFHEDPLSGLSEGMHMGDFDQWDGFDTLHADNIRDPHFGDYLFEDANPFSSLSDPFNEGVKIMAEGGNLSLAALAFEAAVQKDPQHIDAWTHLGAAQAQNEKESPAIRALEQALKLDPSNLDALMGLAVSYTNEGYDSTAYRTLERWLSTKYPSIIAPSDLTPDSDVGFTDRHQLHSRVTSLFIAAAQLSPAGDHMDPDVQVGLGVLFYGDEEYEKAVDCFSAALGSADPGASTSRSQIHLLWNRLGATLANSGRSEDAIAAYEKALTLTPNFVRARYNLGVSCINIGCFDQAAQHLLGALTMHKVVEREGLERVREVVGGAGAAVDREGLERLMGMNQSTNLWETLRRVFSQMGRRDLSDMVVVGMDVEVFRRWFDF